MLKLSFLQFREKFKLTQAKALKLLKLSYPPEDGMEVVDYGDCLSIAFQLDTRFISREIDLRDLQIAM